MQDQERNYLLMGGKNEQFKNDMIKAGYEVRTYRGRGFWKGYAVSVERYDFQDVARVTKVRLQQDSLGLGIIVYPVESMTDEEYQKAEKELRV